MDIGRPWLMVVALFVSLSIFTYLLVLMVNHIPASPDKLDGRIPVAVLGDSDSHNFHDSYDNLRGGEYGDVTFTWTELWEMLYPDEVDQGRMVANGLNYRWARLRYLSGLRAKAPRKLDFEYNYAYSGRGCASLLNDWPYQARWLLQRLHRDQKYWNEGLIIIRIGINDIGQSLYLDVWQDSGLDEGARATVDSCVSQIIQAANAIRTTHPAVSIAISGVVRNYNAASEDFNRSINQIDRIEDVLRYFDESLMAYSTAHDKVAYFDDHFWLTKLFGDKAQGEFIDSYLVDGRFAVNYSSGDHPDNIVLADKHAGTIYNGLWLNNALEQINAQLDLSFSLVEESSLVDIVCRHSDVNC